MTSAMERAELAEAGGEASGSEQFLVQDARARRSPWRAAGSAAAAALLLAGAGAGAARLALRGAASGTDRLQSKAQTVAMPPRDQCAASDEDCYSLGCCNVAGLNCFETKPGKGKCLKNCTPSASQLCIQTQPIMDPILKDADWYGPSLYCFAVVMQDIGSTKKMYDLELLQGAYAKGTGIFGCENWGVFSDKEGEVGPGAPLVKLEDADGDFHFAKREETGTWLNTGLHYQAWKAIGEAGVYKSASWVVKVDADAVFVPSRLVSYLSSKLVPATGIYLENCKNVKYGWFGSLEIFSAVAFETLLGSMASCKDTIDWQTGVDGGKYGPMGEDLFAQVCLDANGVSRGEAFGTKLDGTCEADRPADEKKNKKWKPTCDGENFPAYHPLMKPEDYWACWEATTKAFGY